ncbi:MAG TPA: hypothetical protein PKC28_03705 [Bdellovibrionales bacterium]|nr:hypothetical protein [Bdellovibrionales bacterium]
MFKRRLLLFLLAPLTVFAFEIPKGLDAEDRKEVVRTLGLSTAFKSLANPYPLGGYPGVEVGVSLEYVNVRDVRRLGCTPGTVGCANTRISDETEWRYSRFTVGKGLYDDIDISFSYMPPIGGVNATDYGGAVRWSFFQAQFLPINLSAIAHYNQMNFDDVFSNRNVGIEGMVGVNVDGFSLYFGGGMIEAKGTFIGRDTSGGCGPDCTAEEPESNMSDTRTVTSRVRETHTIVGLSLHYENLFAAAQVDRYRDAVYSMKLGLRF